MPPRHPFFIGKNQVTFQDTIFLLLHTLCIFLGASLLLLSVCLVLFAAINGWTPTNFFWRRCSHFSFAKNTLVFTLIVQRVFSFSRTAFSFCFLPWFFFRSCYIFASRCILNLWSMLVFIKRVVSKRFEWCWKREKIYAKSGTKKGACLDYGLDFCMSCFMYFW
jgi:hypothetical protein